MSDGPKVVEFPGKDDLKGALESMRRDMGSFLEFIVLTAELRKASYDACIAQGFKPEEALELCKNPMLSM